MCDRWKRGWLDEIVHTTSPQFLKSMCCHAQSCVCRSALYPLIVLRHARLERWSQVRNIDFHMARSCATTHSPRMAARFSRLVTKDPAATRTRGRMHRLAVRTRANARAQLQLDALRDARKVCGAAPMHRGTMTETARHYASHAKSWRATDGRTCFRLSCPRPHPPTPRRLTPALGS